MKKTIRLTESDLVRLVKRVIQEQAINQETDIANQDLSSGLSNVTGIPSNLLKKGMDRYGMEKRKELMYELPSILERKGFRIEQASKNEFRGTKSDYDGNSQVSFKNDLLTISIEKKLSTINKTVSMVYTFDLSKSSPIVTIKYVYDSPKSKSMSTDEMLSFIKNRMNTNRPPRDFR